MKKYLAGLVWALGCIAAFAQGGADAPVAVHAVEADVLVQETEGFSPPPAHLDSDRLAGDWQHVALPHAPRPSFMTRPKMAKDDVPYTVVHWYRVRLEQRDRVASPHYLYIPRWKTDGTIAIYADGKLVYRSHANLQWNGSNLPLWIPLDESDADPLPREIVVRMQHLPGIGGAFSSIWAGSGDAIYWRYLTRMLLQAYIPFFSSAAFLALGIFSFVVWVFRRKETLYLLFAAMSAAGYIRSMQFYLGVDRLPLSDEWFGWLTVNSLFWLGALTHFFLLQLHRQPHPWLTRVYVAAVLVEGLATFPMMGGFFDATIVAPWIYPMLLSLSFATFGIHLRSGLRVRSGHTMILASWFLVAIGIGIYDTLLQNNYVNIESMFFGPYGNVGVFFIFTFVVFQRYVNALKAVEDVNASLAQRLWERETELMESHQRLREVEHAETLRQERQRLMQDMHDGLGSSLVSALRAVENADPNRINVAQVLKDCIDDLSLTIDSMEPVEADLLLLLATLRFRLEPRLEGSVIALVWAVRDLPALPWLTPRHSLHILRILQEAIANVIKHAQATEICVATKVEADGVVVTITDNGVGFDPANLPARRGRGLANQRRRAEAIGGKVSWESSRGRTTFSLWLPIQQKLETPVKH